MHKCEIDEIISEFKKLPTEMQRDVMNLVFMMYVNSANGTIDKEYRDEHMATHIKLAMHIFEPQSHGEHGGGSVST